MANQPKTFLEMIERLDRARLRAKIEAATACEVERTLRREQIGPDDLPALLSAAALPYLEELARRSAALTERRFGKVIQLYAPLYYANVCVNRCTYCGFAHGLEVPRIVLTPEQVYEQAEVLHEEGFRHLLLVSGEAPHQVGMDYLLGILPELHRRFDSLAVEIAPLSTDEYRRLVEAGVDGLTVYQETYDPARYLEVHPGGPKRNYAWRLATAERGGAAGMRSLGVGALLGLGEWRMDALVTGLHAWWLTRRFWRSRIAVSFPRIRAAAGGYTPEHPVGDAELVQMLCVMRLLLPDAELVLSTREPAVLRDRLVGLGITRMSAGSRTNPGGYTHAVSGENGDGGEPGADKHAGEQFAVSDPRPPEEVCAMLRARGYEPVWKDFDRQFLAAQSIT
jgi:2-iminoacetate synthase